MKDTYTSKLASSILILFSLVCGVTNLSAQKGFDYLPDHQQLLLNSYDGEIFSPEGSNSQDLFKSQMGFDLALTKELGQGQNLEVEPGDWVTFTIFLHNQGNEVATSVVLADYIPVGMTLMDANWMTDTGHAYFIMPGPIAPNTTSQIDIHMMVDADAPHGSLLNCAEIGSATEGIDIVFGDIDSNFDAVSSNDGAVTDNEVNNNNNDEDDHDCAYVKVVNSVAPDPCGSGVVSCPIDSYCVIPVVPMTICPDVCNIVGGYTITESSSLYHCSIDITAGGCVVYTAVPGLDALGVDQITLTIVSDAGCTYNYVADLEVGDCGANQAPIAIADETYGSCTGIGINPLFNDYDPNPGDVISICGYEQPANGVVTQDGIIFYYVPNPGFMGVDTFNYTVCDNNGASTQSSVIVNVSLCNSAPVANDDSIISDCQKVWLYVLDNDFDLEGPVGQICDYTEPTTGTLLFYDTFFTFIPAAGSNGPVTFTYTICDPDGLSDTATVSIEVNGCNVAPVAGDDSFVSTCEKIWMYVLDNDFDDNGIPVICDYTEPSTGSLFFFDTFFTYIPEAGFNGDATFTYTICDSFGAETEATVTVSVGCNVAPVALPDSYDATCDPIDLYVLDNDSDPEGSALTICDYTEPTLGTLVFNGTHFTYVPEENQYGFVNFSYTACDDLGLGTITTVTVNIACACSNDPVFYCTSPLQGIEICPEFCALSGNITLAEVVSTWHCSVTENGNGCFTYMPLPGFFGEDSVGLEACDDTGACDELTIYVNVGDCSGMVAPQANNDSYNITCGATVLDLLANDTQENGGALTVCDFDIVSGGTLVMINGELTFTPPQGLVGLINFSYTACNEFGMESTAQVTINYNCICEEGPYQECTPELTTLTFCPTVCSFDDYTIANATSAYHCSVTPLGNGCVNYTPVPGYMGIDIVTLEVCDLANNCIDIIYNVTVGDCGATNSPPTANDDIINTGCDLTKLIVLGNDTDIDGESLAICGFTQPDFGKVYQDGDFVFYTPNGFFSGTDSFEYNACDQAGNSSTATVFINVACDITGPNMPIVKDDLVFANCDLTKVVVLGNDVSVDGDVLSLCGFTQPANGVVYQDQTWLFYTPNDGFTGADTFQYTVCDEQGASATGEVTMEVDCDSPCYDAPVSACTMPMTPVDICLNFCTPGAVFNNIVTNLNASVTELGGNCFRYIPGPGAIEDVIYASSCNQILQCETIQVEITIDSSCTNPGVIGLAFEGNVADSEKCSLDFPNAFSPNGDGVNDVFRAYEMDACYEGAILEIVIFNAAGNLMSNSHSRENNSVWDGNLNNGNRAPSGTYFYVVNVEMEDRRRETYKGFIEVR